jgi:hypothetical protein
MISPCAGGEHRLEYRHSADGGDYYACLDCGEVIHQYIDGIGG